MSIYLILSISLSAKMKQFVSSLVAKFMLYNIYLVITALAMLNANAISIQ